ncbi:insecticidal delta-endotoxin Cry8Ea1 family protein [Bacillus thuringiensis]|uniref:Crystaline entomocidal protoxin n=1 Tax=Bacillus thuringiensis TaxID=1428 RepID=A0A3S6Q0Z7_BACTU|nr:insecticidal delta-endotoxin Cry8Ea1 family protein [Bacillus thuringiensis]ATY50148.1 toxin [Bacillus thuringiensis]
MSPNNQNEYEIIDTPSRTSVSNDSVRYPFASDPTTDLNNMNYKDFLKTVNGYNTGDLSGSEAFISQTAINTAGKAVGTVLGLLGVPLAGAVGPLISFYGAVALLFWGPGDPWQAFMTQVEALVNQKIADYARNKAIAELQGLRNLLDLYRLALIEWEENPTRTRSLTNIRLQFEAVNQFFEYQMPSFAVGGYEVPLLAVYAQAANLHLSLLRDAATFGEQWGMSQTAINNIYDLQQRRTIEYTNHCVKWYNNGLDKLRGSTAGQWVNFNRYRREMTLMVLDIVALFPNYDTRTYPSGIGTSVQLTREVYTDPIGSTATQGGVSWYDDAPSFTAIESSVVRPPHLFDLLTEVTVYAASSSWDSTHYFRFWNGHKVETKGIRSSVQYSKVYGSTSNAVSTTILPFSGFDVYRTVSIAGVLLAWTTRYFGTPRVRFDRVPHFSGIDAGFTIIFGGIYEGIGVQEKNSLDELPLQSVGLTYASYSHRLNHISMVPQTVRTRNVPVFSWTHRSADIDNRIFQDRINQIPVVKGHTLGPGASVMVGPGFTGGNIVTRTSPGVVVFSGVTINDTLSQRYRVRIRYASTTDFRFFTTISGSRIYATQATKTMNKGQQLTYESFKYATINSTFTFENINDSLTIGADNFLSGEQVYIDRYELIPEDVMFEAENDLEVAKKAVNELFTNAKDALQTDVTDYQVNQAANLVECLSSELYPNEKRLLFDAVKEAKRLDQARNLLQDTQFNEMNGENGWNGSTGVEIVEDDAFFKDRSIRLSSAREVGTENFPTYLYQKIDESRLKPYTRYSLRGFVRSSQNLEIYVIRYQTQRVVKNVVDNFLPDMYAVNACGGVDRCGEQKYVNTMLGLENNVPNGNTVSDSHGFSIHVDTGEVNYNENTGIWVVFKIPTTDGYATLGNLELVEEGPLSGDTLERVRKQEKQWQDQMARRRAETETRYGAAKQAIDRLFIDYQDQQLSPGTDISDLTAAQNVVQSIPYVYNDMLPEIPGMNYTSVTELTNRLQQAWDLYDQRNSIQNGDFRNDVSNWNVTPGVNIQQMNDTSVLVIPNWDSQASQQITVQPNRRYVLRVTARKEGSGDGYVTIRDGANHTETLTFNTCDYNESSVYQEQAMYTNGQDTNDVYNTQSVNRNGSNSAYHTQAPNTNSYHTSGMYGDQTSYVTKTVEFIPYTEQVWIEMSETEGVFYIESVELIVEEN